ncbi:MAG: DUF2150 family protein [Archaeoglobaceae archaeon]|nr:DUF2150 family protein [Archaeoglobaceae archaeon]MDW8128116.1 DUF2150 family protein [Archaeoglobaceae archaeon]
MDFYPESRIQNWINKIEESNVSEEDPGSLVVFDQMLEDVIIACFSILNAVKDREIKKADALKEFDKILSLFSKKYVFNSELKADIFMLTVEAIKASLESFKYYLEGKFSKKSIKDLIKEAVENEKSGKLDLAFDAIARAGAKVIKGEKLPDLNLPDDSLILSWIDGIDAINMVVELSRIDASEETQEDEADE